jgi:hypothetical protein
MADVKEDRAQDQVLREMNAFEGNGQRTSPERREINDASISPCRFKKGL